MWDILGGHVSGQVPPFRNRAPIWELIAKGVKDDLRPTLPMYLSLPSRLCGVLSLY